jgi:hypothetical protein
MRLRVLFTNLDDNTGCVAHLKTLSGQQLHNSQLPQHRSFAICHSAMIIMRIRCTVLGNLHDGRLSLRSASGVRSDTGKARCQGHKKCPLMTCHRRCVGRNYKLENGTLLLPTTGYRAFVRPFDCEMGSCVRTATRFCNFHSPPRGVQRGS